MENKKKLYIVSFGDSRKYRLPFTEKDFSDGLHHADMNPLFPIENEIRAYLDELFPGENLAFYTSAKVTEVEWDHRDKYESYPLLDQEAVSAIKQELAKEVRDMMATQELNSDAPYSNIAGGVQG